MDKSKKKINKTILKEYTTMSLQSFSDGQIEVVFPDDQDLTHALVTLKPNNGIYKDGKFEFAVRLPEDYPNSAPSVTCKTKIFHPNISFGGKICFNILGGDEWQSSLRLVDYVHGLLWLLYQPNLDSRLNRACPQDTNQFARLVRRSILGGIVEGEYFPCALADPSARPTAVRPVVRPIQGPVTMRDLRAYFQALADQDMDQGPATAHDRVRRSSFSTAPVRHWEVNATAIRYVGTVRVCS